MDFTPAQAGETDLFGIDFIEDLSIFGGGEQLLSAVFTIGVVSGVDATPSTHLAAAPYVAINPNTMTGLATLAVQKLSGLLAGVEYWLEAAAVTTQGRTLELWARIPPEDPPEIWSQRQ
jgi:hypothetical protein